jgi:hypothetical protein
VLGHRIFFVGDADREIMDKIGRWAAVFLLSAGLVPLGGCRICADCEDLAYPAYGGAWQRTQRYAGRVGSVFDPAGARSPTLSDREGPPTPDELERQRQQSSGEQSLDPDRRLEGGFEDDRSPRSETDDLLERALDDIRDEKEDELRERTLDDINIRVIPPPPIPETLH